MQFFVLTVTQKSTIHQDTRSESLDPSITASEAKKPKNRMHYPSHIEKISRNTLLRITLV